MTSPRHIPNLVLKLVTVCAVFLLLSLALGQLWPAARIPMLMTSFGFCISAGIFLCVRGVLVLLDLSKKQKR
jgi:hypothetical protein